MKDGKSLIVKNKALELLFIMMLVRVCMYDFIVLLRGCSLPSVVVGI